MDKYKQNLLHKMKHQLDSWLNLDQTIEQDDLYRFLHSLSGTAPTIGLYEIGEISSSLLKQIMKLNREVWLPKEVQRLMFPLISACYEVEVPKDGHVGSDYEIEKDLIMLIDDDTSLLMFIKEQLENEGYAVVAFTDSSRGMNSYYDFEPDCIVIDMHMKDKSGLDTLMELKNLMKKRYVPTIMISADETKETRLNSYRYGADDFITKPFDIDEFLIRVQRQIEKKKNIDELVILDELTRVYNRKFLQPVYDRLHGRLMREGHIFSLGIIDLDRFKRINDTYGHAAGDAVLVGFAECIKQTLRSSDVLIRYGGEEFIVLLPGTTNKQAKEVLDRVRRVFETQVFTYQDQEFTCTFSAGVIEVNKEQHAEKTVELADAALYEAKLKGRNNIQLVFSEEAAAGKKTLNVAIVDDDPIIRTILSDLFQKSKLLSEQFELNIAVFRDGMEFIESHFYNKKEHYFIVLDGMMPKMDGIEVLQKIRSLPNQHFFTIMMLTSRKSDHDISKALQLGADDYLTKPFRLLELESRLHHLIKRMK
ncbi:GGDEF domain-containing response regulator [Metabacillus idriensis]|uniref:GGDEF domain-containing response regulator n=1 Tax=Metabacillus idriensis TaxID=324768 RepID=UPI003D2BA935